MWKEFGDEIDRMEVPGGHLYRNTRTGSIAFAPNAEPIGVEDVYALTNALGATLQSVVERLDSIGEMLDRRLR